MRGGKRRSRGQGALEFALILPVFLLIVLGIVEFGRGVASYALLANAAREGARAGIFYNTDDATIIAAVNSQSLLLGAFPSADNGVTIEVDPSGGAREYPNRIKVTLSYRFHPMTELLTRVTGPTITMWASSEMPIE